MCEGKKTCQFWLLPETEKFQEFGLQAWYVCFNKWSLSSSSSSFYRLFCCRHRKFSRSASLFWFLSWRKQKSLSSLLLLVDCFVAVREVFPKLLLSSDSCLEKNKEKPLISYCLVYTIDSQLQTEIHSLLQRQAWRWWHRTNPKQKRWERERERVACYKIRLLHYYCSNEEEKHKLLEGGERNTWRRRR